ncbi:MAG: ATPase [Myxococcales bacterium]|nr:ATPase [Myxococcales bacterium]
MNRLARWGGLFVFVVCGHAFADVARPVRLTERAEVPKGADLRTVLERSADEADAIEVELVHGKKTWTLRRCSDYVPLRDGEVQTVDVANQRFFLRTTAHCRALSLLVKAKPATRSFLDDFALGAAALDLLPADLRFEASSRNARAQAGKTWRAVDPKARATGHEPNLLRVTGRGYQNEVSEYGRGDVNGDGVEDVVVRTEGYATGGTYVEHAAYALTRLGPDVPLTIVARWRGAY